MIFNVNYMILSSILIFLVLSFYVTNVTIKDRSHKILVYIFISGFTIYSGIGLSLFEINNSFLYFLQYILFIIIFIFYAIVSSNYFTKTSSIISNDLTRLVVKVPKLVSFFALIYLLTYVFPYIYPNFQIIEVLNIQKLFLEYSPTKFSDRILRANDSISHLVTSQIRLIAMPFFFIFLYQKRRNIPFFVFLFILPFYLTGVFNGYLSRNVIATIIVFLFIYLIKEKFISKAAGMIITCIAVPLLLYSFGNIFYIRMGLDFGTAGFVPILIDLVSQETSFVKNFSYASQISDQVNVFEFLLYILTLPIPASIISAMGIYTPVFSYLLTEQILGMSYGDPGYYVILPSILGEGIIIFNKYFAWVYALILGFFAFGFLRIFKSNELLSYLLVWYLIDFVRQMRGGSQFIISTWLNLIIPFIIIIYIAKIIVDKKKNRSS